MGMYYKAKLIVGLPYEELEEIDEEIIDDLDRASPYYDCDQDEQIYGVEVISTSDFSYVKFSYNQDKVDAAKAEFKEVTGLEGRLYLSTHGY